LAHYRRRALAKDAGISPDSTGSHRLLIGSDAWRPSDKSWREQIMKFRSHVEPLEPMMGLEVPPEVVKALGGGKRPAVTITINGHSWKAGWPSCAAATRSASANANRKIAGVVTGEKLEVEVEIDAEPRYLAFLDPSIGLAGSRWRPVLSWPTSLARPTSANSSMAASPMRAACRIWASAVRSLTAQRTAVTPQRSSPDLP
jgi:hypothetical protein